MERNSEISELLRLYFQGETTLDQERALKEYSRRSPSCSQEPNDMLFALWESAAAERCPSSTDDAIRKICSTGKAMFNNRATRIFTQNRYWLVATAAACILLALYIIPSGKSSEIYCYLNGKPVTNVETARQQAYLISNLLHNGIAVTKDGIQSAHDALRALSAFNGHDIIGYLSPKGVSIPTNGREDLPFAPGI